MTQADYVLFPFFTSGLYRSGRLNLPAGATATQAEEMLRTSPTQVAPRKKVKASQLPEEGQAAELASAALEGMPEEERRKQMEGGEETEGVEYRDYAASATFNAMKGRVETKALADKTEIPAPLGPNPTAEDIANAMPEGEVNPYKGSGLDKHLNTENLNEYLSKAKEERQRPLSKREVRQLRERKEQVKANKRKREREWLLNS